MNIEATLSFLRELAASPASDESLVSSLLSALTQDGYSLHLNEPHYLRRLESTAEPGSTDYTVSVILVTVCVICAGCASGLTQVRSLGLPTNFCFMCL